MQVVIIVGVVALAAVVAIRFFDQGKNKNNIDSNAESTPKPNIDSKTETSSNQAGQDDRYIWHKRTIQKAIEEKDFDYLERAKDTRMQDYPDLIAMIDEALKNKPN